MFGGAGSDALKRLPNFDPEKPREFRCVQPPWRDAGFGKLISSTDFRVRLFSTKVIHQVWFRVAMRLDVNAQIFFARRKVNFG